MDQLLSLLRDNGVSPSDASVGVLAAGLFASLLLRSARLALLVCLIFFILQRLLHEEEEKRKVLPGEKEESSPDVPQREDSSAQVVSASKASVSSTPNRRREGGEEGADSYLPSYQQRKLLDNRSFSKPVLTHDRKKLLDHIYAEMESSRKKKSQ